MGLVVEDLRVLDPTRPDLIPRSDGYPKYLKVLVYIKHIRVFQYIFGITYIYLSFRFVFLDIFHVFGPDFGKFFGHFQMFIYVFGYFFCFLVFFKPNRTRTKPDPDRQIIIAIGSKYLKSEPTQTRQDPIRTRTDKF